MEETKEEYVLDHKGLKYFWFKFRKNGETVFTRLLLKKNANLQKQGRSYATAMEYGYNKMYRQMGLKYKMSWVFVDAGESVE